MEFIKGFSGENRPLSNFYPAPLMLDGIAYPTSEHAYQAAKFPDRDQRVAVSQAGTPFDAKQAGQGATVPPGWNEFLAVKTMKRVVVAKFDQNPDLARFLFGTAPSILVETNRWHDQRWGDCVCGNPSCSAPGANMLGIILMDTRTELRAKQSKQLLRIA